MATRKPFSLTFVTYESGDHLGQLMALLSLLALALKVLEQRWRETLKQ